MLSRVDALLLSTRGRKDFHHGLFFPLGRLDATFFVDLANQNLSKSGHHKPTFNVVGFETKPTIMMFDS